MRPADLFMRPAELWRHSSFRLALGVTALILAALILASGIAFGLVNAQLSQRQDTRVTEIFFALQENRIQGDEAELVEALNARIDASPSFASVYLLRDAQGQTLAGNIADTGLPAGWATVPATRIGLLNEYPYRIYTGKLGPYDLTVGLSNADQDDFHEIMLGAFGWGTTFALIATLLAGVVLALRVQNQMSQAEIAMSRLAQGDLTSRLPVSGRDDDLDRISEAINAALARLAGLVEAMRQVSADVAHELRTPMNRLRLRIEMAAEKSASGQPVDQELSAALAESEAIDQIFSALLRIAQIEGGARRERFETLDLAGVMANLHDIYAEVAADAGMALLCHPTGPAQVQGDRELLTQAFANLIENALRHCPAGTTIICAIDNQAGQVTASIRDNGPGIPQGETDLVLRRLYRLEKSRTTHGSGLGLTLVKAVADLHGAKLTLADAAPGLRVEIAFPKS